MWDSSVALWFVGIAATVGVGLALWTRRFRQRLVEALHEPIVRAPLYTPVPRFPLVRRILLVLVVGVTGLGMSWASQRNYWWLQLVIVATWAVIVVVAISLSGRVGTLELNRPEGRLTFTVKDVTHVFRLDGSLQVDERRVPRTTFFPLGGFAVALRQGDAAAQAFWVPCDSVTVKAIGRRPPLGGPPPLRAGLMGLVVAARLRGDDDPEAAKSYGIGG
jgi:hypothetical protein